MLSICLALSCLFTNIQSQNVPVQFQYYPYFRDPNYIYFQDQVNALPLSLPTQTKTTQLNDEIIKQIFGESPQKNTLQIQNNNAASASGLEGQSLTKGQGASQRVQGGNVGQAVDSTPAKQQSVSPNGYNSLLYSVTNLGFNLLKRINAAQSGNLVLSPYSITSLLALLQQGALRQTQKEISRALRMSPAESAAAYLEISTDYKQRNTRNILKTASNVFVSDTFNLNSTFKQIAQKNFDSDITPVSFEKSSEAARQINSWVASRTDNKIEKLISPDFIQESTQVILVNAIYFKGLWEVPFKADSTKPGEFHLSNGASKTVDFMRMKSLFKIGLDSTTNAQVVILPFERNQYSMMIILPSSADNLSSTLASLSDARLLSYLSYSLEETDLQIPKFTVRADTDLALLLKDMGIKAAFGPNAELSGLGTYRAFSPQISSAIHSAVLSIDEQGGSAAAATAFAAVALSYDEPTVVTFKADRPFIAILWDTASSLPLFMAKIEDPLQ